MEDKQIVIDLDALNESSSLALFGAQVHDVLDSMFGNAPMTSVIKGEKRKVEAFGKALSSEKKYMDAYIKYGDADARTQRDAATLNNAIKAFEKATGLQWPIK